MCEFCGERKKIIGYIVGMKINYGYCIYWDTQIVELVNLRDTDKLSSFVVRRHLLGVDKRTMELFYHTMNWSASRHYNISYSLLQRFL